jgi:hypothetical protein
MGMGGSTGNEFVYASDASSLHSNQNNARGISKGY